MHNRDSLGRFVSGSRWDERFYWDKEWLYKEYVIKNKSSVTIGKERGCRAKVIQYWLRKHNIPRKKQWKRTEEVRFEMSKRMLGKQPTSQTRQKMSDSQKERWVRTPIEERRMSEAQKKKISETNKRRGIKPIFRFCESGEKHPMWKDGSSLELYPSEFNKDLKERIRERDSYVCILCGKGEIFNGRRLGIHHINENKNDCRESNLCALCNSCNSKKDTAEKEFLIRTNLGILDVFL